MFYIDIISDGGHTVDPVRAKNEEAAYAVFEELERQALDMSENYDMEFSVRMYDDNDNIIAGTVYVDGKRIA